MSLFEFLKNAFFILLFLQLTPPLLDSVSKQYAGYLHPKTRVGVIAIKGVLYSSERINKELNKYFKDTTIKAILLKVDSPGSAAGTAHAISHEINSLKKEHPKPIMTLVENNCTSGAYMIAAQTDRIIAPGSAMVGSIGTSFPYVFQLNEFMKEHKIGYIPLTAGTYKSSGDPFTALSEDDKQHLQTVLNDAYDQFVALVARRRKLNITTKKQWADGKLFTARQALQLGLIDQIGSAYSATEQLKKHGLIDGEIEWVKTEQPSGLAQLFGRADNKTDSLFSTSGIIVMNLISALWNTQSLM